MKKIWTIGIFVCLAYGATNSIDATEQSIPEQILAIHSPLSELQPQEAAGEGIEDIMKELDGLLDIQSDHVRSLQNDFAELRASLKAAPPKPETKPVRGLKRKKPHQEKSRQEKSRDNCCVFSWVCHF